MEILIRFDRLKEDLETLARFGRDPRGGITRPSFSKADLEARKWLEEKIRSAGLVFRQDGAGNIFSRIEGKGKTVMAGSHIDTVVNSGMFDGAAGVLAALECLRRIKEEKIPHAKPLEVASFTDEEGNLVGDFLGSRAFAGLLKREDLEQGTTQFGPPLEEVLAGTEFSIDTIMNARKEAPELDAFLELHIEQGTVLEIEDIPIGLVDRIAGKQYRWCSFMGTASHAGTTPLELRRDAFLGLADFALKATQHVATRHYGSMVTIGKICVNPGVFSVVPARADFSLDFRSTSEETLHGLEQHLLAIAQDVASTRGLTFVSKVMDQTRPVDIPPRILETMEEECRKLDYPSMRLPSGAGHDAQILAGLADAGMIFIPSIDGISHSPEESIRWEDLKKAANLLLRVLIRLAA